MIYNSMVTTWYQGLDGKSMWSVCSLRVKFNLDLEKAYTHRQRKNKKELGKFMK